MPPPAVSVVLLPLQIVKEGEAVMVGVGKALTVIVFVATDVHADAFVTVNAYPVFTVGVTVIAEVVALVFHL